MYSDTHRSPFVALYYRSTGCLFSSAVCMLTFKRGGVYTTAACLPALAGVPLQRSAFGLPAHTTLPVLGNVALRTCLYAFDFTGSLADLPFCPAIVPLTIARLLPYAVDSLPDVCRAAVVSRTAAPRFRQRLTYVTVVALYVPDLPVRCHWFPNNPCCRPACRRNILPVAATAATPPATTQRSSSLHVPLVSSHLVPVPAFCWPLFYGLPRYCQRCPTSTFVDVSSPPAPSRGPRTRACPAAPF